MGGAGAAPRAPRAGKKTPKLTVAQRRGLGAGAPADVYSAAVGALHRRPRACYLQRDDELQSYDEFADAGTREPNAEGTGRWVPTASRRAVAVLPLHWAGEDGGAPPAALRVVAHAPDTERVVELCGCYFGLPAVVHPLAGDLQLRVIDAQPHVVQVSTGVAFPLEFANGSGISYTGKGSRRKPKRGSAAEAAAAAELAVEVWSLFAVLEEFVQEDHYCLVAVSSLRVAEDDRPDNHHLGRACGNRVSVVSVPACSTTRECMATMLHETMHCFGLDHCTLWRCLMNSTAGGDEAEDLDGGYMHLCPMDLRKMQLACGFDIKERFERLAACYSSLGWDADASWVEKRLAVTGS